MIVDKAVDCSQDSNELTLEASLYSLERNSGIELLKIFAVFLIILGHVIQTLSSQNTLVNSQDYVLDLRMCTTNLQQLILAIILRHSGIFGNSMFFACSAWFLLDSKRVNKKKIWFMLLEIWSVSIVILAITYILRAGNISTGLIIMCLFPTTFSLNWYMTCYLLFYLIHSVLNGVIDRMSQTDLLKTASLLLLTLNEQIQIFTQYMVVFELCKPQYMVVKMKFAHLETFNICRN